MICSQQILAIGRIGGRLTLWAVGFLCEDKKEGGLRGMARIRAAPRIAALIAILALGGCGDTFLPSYGPRSVDVRTHSTEPDALPYATVRLTPEVVDILASHDPRLANVFADRRPPPALRFGVGDIVSVTIFEAAAGGLFIPIEAGVRPGNFITLPNQRVDNRGNITVPYAGSIRGCRSYAHGGPKRYCGCTQEPSDRTAGCRGTHRPADLADQRAGRRQHTCTVPSECGRRACPRRDYTRQGDPKAKASTPG